MTDAGPIAYASLLAMDAASVMVVVGEYGGRRSARLFYKLQALPCELADRHATACFHVVRTPGMLQHSQTRSGPRYIRAGVYVCVYVCPVSYINAPGAVRGSETREVGSGDARGGRGKLPPPMGGRPKIMRQSDECTER